MTRFIQIHTLTGYSSVLINRDDSGLAKRISYGGTMRTRISSQCLKRAWRTFAGDNAIADIDASGRDVRTKKLVEAIAARIAAPGMDEKIFGKVQDTFVKAVYGDKAKIGKGEDEAKDSRQPLLFGPKEVAFIEAQMAKAMQSDDPEAAAKDFAKDYKATMKAMREQSQMASGLTAALFGRMVTSDVAANMDAAIHVAHAITTHADRSESDFFSVVDDLAPADETGAGHIGESEIGSGLFYGYVVVDVEGLIANIGGDAELAAEIVRRLVLTIASVSPGAKRGSTAPYGYASSMLVEAGNAQPRSLAEAMRSALAPTHAEAEEALASQLARHDAIFATGENRAWLSVRNTPAFPGEGRTLAGLADFAAEAVLGKA